MNFKHITAAIALSTAFMGAAAMAQTASPPSTPAKAPVVAAAKAPAAKKAPSAAQLAQRAKMKSCNQQASGKKGADRKAFMKTCLSK